MPVNPYMDVRLAQEDTNLFEDLIEEFIQFSGFDTYYIPRKRVTTDKILGEILSSRFENYYVVEMALEEKGGWAREHIGLSKFGIQFTGDSVKLSVSKRRFAQAVPNAELKQDGQPAVGDLLFIPFVEQLHEIVRVSTMDPYLSGGQEFVFIVELQPFKYSSEKFDRPNFDIKDLDGSSVIDEFVRQFDGSDKKAPSSDTFCHTVDSIDVTVDNDQVGVDRVLTADREFETVDSESYTADDDFDKALERTINALNDRIPGNMNGAIGEDASSIVSEEPDFGYR